MDSVAFPFPAPAVATRGGSGGVLQWVRSKGTACMVIQQRCMQSKDPAACRGIAVTVNNSAIERSINNMACYSCSPINNSLLTVQTILKFQFIVQTVTFTYDVFRRGTATSYG
jgi:hypothetical protein